MSQGKSNYKGETNPPIQPVQKFYPLEIRSKGEGLSNVDNSVRAVENPTRTVRLRNAALDSR